MKELLGVFKAMSDDTRLRILKLLEKGELCVCDLVAALDMVQPKVSFHLAVLKESRLIKDKKVGRWCHYGIDDTDMFRRFIVLCALDKIPEAEMTHYIKRLDAFRSSKDKKSRKTKN